MFLRQFVMLPWWKQLIVVTFECGFIHYFTTEAIYSGKYNIIICMISIFDISEQNILYCRFIAYNKNPKRTLIYNSYKFFLRSWYKNFLAVSKLCIALCCISGGVQAAVMMYWSMADLLTGMNNTASPGLIHRKCFMGWLHKVWLCLFSKFVKGYFHDIEYKTYASINLTCALSVLL